MNAMIREIVKAYESKGEYPEGEDRYCMVGTDMPTFKMGKRECVMARVARVSGLDISFRFFVSYAHPFLALVDRTPEEDLAKAMYEAGVDASMVEKDERFEDEAVIEIPLFWDAAELEVVRELCDRGEIEPWGGESMPAGSRKLRRLTSIDDMWVQERTGYTMDSTRPSRRWSEMKVYAEGILASSHGGKGYTIYELAPSLEAISEGFEPLYLPLNDRSYYDVWIVVNDALRESGDGRDIEEAVAEYLLQHALDAPKLPTYGDARDGWTSDRRQRACECIKREIRAGRLEPYGDSELAAAADEIIRRNRMMAGLSA